jgi:zinc/manganese transport system substrate-binding protein
MLAVSTLSPAQRVLGVSIPLGVMALLAGCASPASGRPADGRISVVASTSVYGSIAEAIVGDAAEVTSIIVRGNQDPHGYEATARDQLTLARADLVIDNGGGYDPFVGELLETAGSNPVRVTAVEGGDHTGGETEAAHSGHHGNEHVWYSLHAMHDLAGRLGEALAEVDREHAKTYLANAEQLVDGIESLESRAEELGTAGAGVSALATEPVPLPLLADLGVEDRTPPEFLAAIEDGRDVPPAVLDQTLDLLAGGEIGLVAFNEQTVDATSTRVLDAADAAGVPVVSFSELPPEGTGYVDWMGDNLDRVAEVLG